MKIEEQTQAQIQKQQLQATLEAARRHLARRDQNRPENQDEMCIGTTFLSRKTADFPVEWVLIEEAEERVRVVPLDVHPFVGSRDMERFAAEASGVVRCDLDAWLDPAAVERELFTGALTQDELAEVRRRRGDAIVPTLREEEVDTDPEYRLWREETLRPALEALEVMESPSQEEPANVVQFPGRWHRAWRPALAAAALLAVALPVGWRFSQMDQALEAERARLAAVQQEYTAAQEEYQAQATEFGRLESLVEEARRASESALGEVRSLTEVRKNLEESLARALKDRVVVNLPSFVLGGDSRRRANQQVPDVINPGDAERFTLSVEVVDPDPYDRYQIRLSKVGGEKVWSNDELQTLGGKWLRLDFPTMLLERGVEYEIRVDGISGGRVEELEGFYRIEVEE